jgi:hypothetical protein
MREYPLSDAADVKIVRDRYLKFKRDGRWHRLPISNVDKYRNATTATIVALLQELFADVQYTPRTVPCMVAVTNRSAHELRYLQRYTVQDERTIVATGLREAMLPYYPESIHFHLSVFYMGNRDMWYEYYDVDGDPASSKQLFRDIQYLHDIIIRRQLSPQHVHALVSDFFTRRLLRQPPPPQTTADMRESELEEPLPINATPMTEPSISSASTPFVTPEQPIPAPTHSRESARPSPRHQDDASSKLTLPPIDDMKQHINDLITSHKFQQNFILKAAEWRLHETLNHITDNERANQVWTAFYRLITGDISPSTFYESL